MSRTDAAVLAIRRVVRELILEARQLGYLKASQLAIAVSGGADSLALAVAAVHVAQRMDLRTHGLIVDHQLQVNSAQVAKNTAEQLEALGVDLVRILTVNVDGDGGPEAAARQARYAALRGALPSPDALVLLGHTKNDQAETVLLGLGRGSGARSIAGMSRLDPPWARPLLNVSRTTTQQACAALGLHPWQDPHNIDPAFTRVRLRHEVLPLLEDVLQGGVVDALVRTSAQLRDDCVALDEAADELFDQAFCAAEPAGTLNVEVLATRSSAIRRRVIRRWLLTAGGRDVTDQQIRAIDALIGAWHGQGEVLLRGGLVVGRIHGRLCIDWTHSRRRHPTGPE